LFLSFTVFFFLCCLRPSGSPSLTLFCLTTSHRSLDSVPPYSLCLLFLSFESVSKIFRSRAFPYRLLPSLGPVIFGMRHSVFVVPYFLELPFDRAIPFFHSNSFIRRFPKPFPPPFSFPKRFFGGAFPLKPPLWGFKVPSFSLVFILPSPKSMNYLPYSLFFFPTRDEPSNCSNALPSPPPPFGTGGRWWRLFSPFKLRARMNLILRSFVARGSPSFHPDPAYGFQDPCVRRFSWFPPHVLRIRMSSVEPPPPIPRFVFSFFHVFFFRHPL